MQAATITEYQHLLRIKVKYKRDELFSMSKYQQIWLMTKDHGLINLFTFCQDIDNSSISLKFTFYGQILKKFSLYWKIWNMHMWIAKYNCKIFHLEHETLSAVRCEICSESFMWQIPHRTGGCLNERSRVPHPYSLCCYSVSDLICLQYLRRGRD